MSVFSKKLNKRVLKLLKENALLRDDFMRLLAIVWRQEMEEEHFQKITAFVFLSKIYNKEVTHPGTIERTWRQIQEENPDLRGEDWKKRQVYSKKEVPDEVRKNKEDVNPQGGMDFL